MTSSVAALTVGNFPPAITIQPTNQVTGVSSNVTIVVVATGTEPLVYQWWLNVTNRVVNGLQTGGETISGATSNVLTISNVQTNDNGSYFVVITNQFRIGDQFQCGFGSRCAGAHSPTDKARRWMWARPWFSALMDSGRRLSFSNG